METLVYLAKSTSILTLFYIVYYVVLRKDTLFTAKRHFLLGGIIAAFALPLLEFTKIIYKDVPVMDAIPFSQVISNSAEQVLQQEPAIQFSWWQVLFACYLLGVLLMFGRLAIQFFSLLKLLRSYPSEKKGSFRFIEVADAISPFSFFQYIVFNPSLHSEEELQMIIKHEQIHVSQWHSFDIIMANCARTLQWVNPFAWLYKRSLEENLEFIADSETIIKVASPIQYQLTLVMASSPLYVPALTNNFYQSFIKKRIIMLNKNTSKRHNIWKLSIVLPFLALFLWSFNMKEKVEYREIAWEGMSTTAETSTNKSPIFIAETALKSPVNISEERKKEVQTNATIEAKRISISKAAKEQENIFPSESSLAYADGTHLLKRVLAEYRIKITKNTSNAELDKMKAELKKEHGITMSYNVNRNTSNEITSITIQYSGKGNSGSYSIDEDGPIEDFQFYMTDDGKSGFWSEVYEQRYAERAERHSERIVEREHRVAERHQEMKEREGEMKERMVVRHKEMGHRQAELEEYRNGVAEHQAEIREHQRELARHQVEAVKHREHNVIRHYNIARNSSTVHEGGRHHEEIIVLDKNMSDASLKALKRDLAERNIDFSYKRLKRNAKGEIISIKITIDNNKGSKTVTSHSGDEDEPIGLIELKI